MECTRPPSECGYSLKYSFSKDSNKCIWYAILEGPLLDSSNIKMKDWIRIFTEIELNYTVFDAFVILHDRHHVLYLSTLGFLLEDLGKAVISRNVYLQFQTQS
ncbi:hypothetical protein F5141DRAFT_1252028 [Pisolithus sp. B1]|nr:hypothetical protein F5141DRAFT_1252028 [Pisolithus sp. B1]